jgi:YihY family inner membrane protein
MFTSLADTLKKTALVLGESFAAFRRNNDLTLASSLAFSAMLAIIPALFLLTSLLGMTVGSSQEAFEKVQSLATQVIPGYSQEIMKEVRYIAAHKRTFGAVNFLVFLLVVAPLVSDLRTVLRTIFRTPRSRPFLLEKLFDVAITVVLLLGITAIAALGIALTILKEWVPMPALPGYLGWFVQYLFTAFSVLVLYFAFSGKNRPLHLATGALASAGLWFVMRPLFHQFLVFNPGYGLAFGSFKSLFVVIIWIYYSLAVFLAGAEVAASLERSEVTYVRRLLTGKRGLPAAVAERFIERYLRGETVFGEGEPGDRMYYVLKGSVSVRKGDRELSQVGAGHHVGVASFLLETPRRASAVAAEDAELLTITRNNIGELMEGSPDLALAMLKDSALHLRESNDLLE